MTAPSRERTQAVDTKGNPLTPPPIDGNHSKVIRSQGAFAWEGVALEDYKATGEGYKEITRRELVGKRGESAQFHLRYFEIGPGGYSTLEKHEHEHCVYGVRGQGEAQMGCYIHKVGVGDVVYVSPSDTHQFSCPEDAAEPFGFLCIVNAVRDRPVAADGLGACFICE